MSTNIRHASAVKPISVSTVTAVAKTNWDRCQKFSWATTQPQEKVYEIGRRDKMAVDKDTLEATLSITQLEYGEIDSFLQLAGLSAEPVAGLALSDFDDSRVDFYLPGKDAYGGTLEQTLWLEKMSLDSFNLAINAEAKLERTFNLSGDYAKILKSGNKYLIFTTDDAPSGTSGNYTIDVSDPAPVQIPGSSNYILKIVRIRSGVATELVVTTDYTYSNATKLITILAATTADHYRVWYSAASYGSAGDPTALNDADDYFISAESVTITIDDGVHAAVELTKLTSASIAATLNRITESVIGDTEKVLRDVEDYDVTISLEGFVKEPTIEEALAGQAGQSYGLIDFSDLGEVTVTIKVYEDSTKSVFKIGYQSTGLSFADGSEDWTANEFASVPINVNSDNLLITADIGNL